VTDSYKIRRDLLLDIGLRYDWNGTPIESERRFVVFDPVSDSLLQVGKNLDTPYNQSARNFQQRVGFSWDIGGVGKTVIRSAYAIQTDQPSSSLVTPMARNPPFAFPVSFSPTAGIPFVTFSNAFALAGGTVAPTSIAQSYQNPYAQSWNINIQRELATNFRLMAGYYASKGTHLNIARNYNQPVNGVRPYSSLSANSPVFAGKPLANIIVYESDGNSIYNGLWLTGTKRFSKGLQFTTSYTWSKSVDYNSRNVQGLTVQDSNNLRGDRGLSDFDALHRFVLNGVYELPLHGNRRLEGWQVSSIVTLQSGNPMNILSTNRMFNGAGTLRPSVSGRVQVGFTPATNGNATNVTYIQNRSVFYDQGNAFGNLGRNMIIGPGFSDVDLSLAKNTRIRENLRFRADAFDLLNHASFGQPSLTFTPPITASSTFGLISNTRFPTGDSGSSRQVQLAMKLIF
jgi:hypothetical protein